MEIILKTLRRKELSDTKIMQFTLDRDMNVPENLGDIMEIVNSVGNIIVDEDRVVGDKIYVKGNLPFEILYVTEEGEMRLAELSGKIDFDEVMRIDGSMDGIWRVSAKLEDVGVTMIHPRKVSVTALVTLNAVCCGEKECQVICDIDEKNHVECMGEEQVLSNLIYSGIDRAAVKEEIGIMSGNPNIGKIIFSTCNLMDCEAVPGKDSYRLNGKLSLFIIYQAEDSQNPYALWEQEIPFEKEIEAMGIDENCVCLAKPRIGRVGLEVGNDDDGEPRLVTVAVELSCDAEIYSESRITLLRDAYAVDGILTLEKQKQVSPVSLSVFGQGLKINDRIALPEGTDDVGEILHVEACVSVEDVTCDGEGVHIAGAIPVTCYYRSTSDAAQVRVMKQDFEFVEHIPVAVLEHAENSLSRCGVYGTVDYVQVRPGAAGEYEVKAGVNLKCMLC
ncbi:MAG: DUF3794 domain-containing protein, partial [Lachnospiraceae bacterium]